MEPALNTAIHSIFADTSARYQLPGMILAIARGDTPVEHVVLGTDAAGQPLAQDTLLPVASITKLATALAVLRLSDAGQLELDGLLARYLPQAASAQPGVTLRTLLCHTSGLPLNRAADAAPWNAALTWDALVQAWLATPLARTPSTRVGYSNVGYALLGLVIERITGMAYGTALRTIVLEPLGIEAYHGVEPPRTPGVIANPNETEPAEIAQFNSAFARKMATPAGNLVTTAAGALALLRAFGGRPAGFLRPETCAEATRNQVGDLGGGVIGFVEHDRCPWGLGPWLYSSIFPFMDPKRTSPGSYGHAGTSGCIVWADPAVDTAWAILGTLAGGLDDDWSDDAVPAIGDAILTQGSGFA